MFVCNCGICFCAQQIDDILAGSLTQEDEDAVLAELEAITQVCVCVSLQVIKLLSRCHLH